MKECKAFGHKLSYVTDREDIVQCNRCFRNWELMKNETPFDSRHFTFDQLYDLRKKYK